MRVSPGRVFFNMINAVFLTLVTAITLYPVLYVVFASFSDPARMIQHQGPLFWFTGFSVLGYRYLAQDPMILLSFGNSFIIMFSGVAINLVMTMLGAYFLTRKQVFWKKAVLAMILFTMYFSGGLVPQYINIRNLGLYNTYFALILPAAISTTNLIIMRTAFSVVPSGLEESAVIDGAGHLVVLLRILIPLSLPTIAVLALYYAVGHWNSWFPAMIYLKDRESFPLQLILREKLILSQSDASATGGDYGDAYMVRETMKYAIIVLSSLPMLVLYPFTQKYFIRGVMIGALKG